MTFTYDAAREAGSEDRRWREHLDTLALPAVALDRPRLVVLAAHPDDESLGAGGLLARAHREGVAVTLVVATAGEASHPQSATHAPARLAEVRRAEVREAAEALAPGCVPVLLDLPDGELADHEDDLVDRLVELVGDGRDCLLVAPWRHDRHPDHEAAGRAAATVAARTDARLLEYAVWLWHWGGPADAPWESAQRVELTDADRDRRRAAQAAHRSQVEPLSSEPGDEVLLGPGLLAHFDRPDEVLFAEPVVDEALERLHAAEPEPWHADSRWFERRKRGVLLAMLPRERFRLGVELGCSTGVLTAELAGRCEVLRAIDASPTAVEAARRRLLQDADPATAEVRQGVVPGGWPVADGERPDLVVLSEVGYFLSHGALEELARLVRRDLADDGVVVLCHWRHEVVGWPLDGPDVHARLTAAGLPPVAATYEDRDVEVLVLAAPDLMPGHED